MNYINKICNKIDTFFMLSSFMPPGYKDDFQILANDSIPLVCIFEKLQNNFYNFKFLIFRFFAALFKYFYLL